MSGPVRVRGRLWVLHGSEVCLRGGRVAVRVRVRVGAAARGRATITKEATTGVLKREISKQG